MGRSIDYWLPWKIEIGEETQVGNTTCVIVPALRANVPGSELFLGTSDVPNYYVPVSNNDSEAYFEEKV